LQSAGIAFSGHLGLEPQHHAEKRLRGRSVKEAAQLIAAARALDKAGISLLVLELIPEEVAAGITQAIAAPTIGIGAGRMTDGQVLVVNDLLGVTGTNFRHNRRYAEFGMLSAEALANYIRDVRERRFPGEENAFHLPQDEILSFQGEKP
jgi:3-methyl-2-oxobutanoate hydroxymethyltransferase